MLGSRDEQELAGERLEFVDLCGRRSLRSQPIDARGKLRRDLREKRVADLDLLLAHEAILSSGSAPASRSLSDERSPNCHSWRPPQRAINTTSPNCRSPTRTSIFG